MKPLRPLLALSAFASVLFLLASSFTSADWTVLLKVASIALLAVLGFRVNRLLGIALSFGALGDFLLGIHRLGNLGAEKLFLFGLGAFLIGHLVYIAMFRRFLPHSWARHSPLRELGIMAVLLTLWLVLASLQSSLGPLLMPVIVYALVLAAMASTAILAELGNPLAAIGALLFVASDAMLAIAKFRGPCAGHNPLIWITYYLAQALIFLAVERHAREQSSSQALRGT
jgi:uncharacterized membrane protein YhhN